MIEETIGGWMLWEVSAKLSNRNKSELAKEMLKDGETFEKIQKYTYLSDEILREIASTLGVAIVM